MRIPFSASALAVMALLALPGAAATGAIAATATPITLDQAMAHPDWIGNPVESAWWSWDGKQVLYKQKRAGSPLRDIWQTGAQSGLNKAHQVGDAELSKLDSADVVYNRDRSRAV